MATELWLALDVSDTESAIRYTKELREYVDVYKIGLELFTSEGPKVVEKIKKHGGRVFLDLKFNDIPNTVAGAVRNITKLGADYIDIHACGGPDMMKAAVEAAKEEACKCGYKVSPKVLAITVLTSIDDLVLKQLNIKNDSKSLVKDWAQLAKKCGLDGVVNSLQEVSCVREVCGVDFLSVTPGIRTGKQSKDDDQQRVGTPEQAVQLGSSAIVVGRPILKAKDPLAAAAAIKDELLRADKGL